MPPVLPLLAACAALPGGYGPALPDGPPAVELRLATWNVEGLGAPGSAGFEAAADVLARLDADVAILQEVGVDEAPALRALADVLGVTLVAAPPPQPFGDVGLAVLARRDDVGVAYVEASALSDDGDANDLTRLPVAVTLPAPEAEATVVLVGVHLKSGWLPADAFRRSVEALRTARLVGQAAGDVVLVAGDLNDDPADDDPASPRLAGLPTDLPPGFRLGADLRARLAARGLPAAVAPALAEAGLAPLPARQRDGSRVTRPASGRALDAFLGDPAARAAWWRAEVVDPADADLPGLPLADVDLPDDAARRASDHLPVLGILGLPRR